MTKKTEPETAETTQSEPKKRGRPSTRVKTQSVPVGPKKGRGRPKEIKLDESLKLPKKNVKRRVPNYDNADPEHVEAMKKKSRMPWRGGDERNMLSEVHEKFAQLLAAGYGQTEAYREVFKRNNKPEVARVEAHRLAKRPEIRARVIELRTAAQEKAKNEFAIDRVAILRELFALATVDLRKAYDDNGALLPPKEWPEELARAIAGVETMEEFDRVGDERVFVGYTRKIKLFDKGKALDMAMRHLGEYDKDNQQKTNPLNELANAILGNVVKPGQGANLARGGLMPAESDDFGDSPVYKPGSMPLDDDEDDDE
ncbi:MAG TPA: terminase small subunit [Limnobacter sp.]|nr:terminase small subunit [Limnobacter sp.]